MPKNRTTYTIFISAPSDVSAEVEVVREVIHDVNLLIRALDVEFDAFHWVDDVTPGATENAQGRINEQADGYDVIVAIFGSKLGTATAKYDSGTVEEIEISLSNKESLTFNDDSVIVLFKHLQIDAAYGDLEAAARVQKYRKSLAGRALYKEFETESELKEYLLKALSPVLAKHLGGGILHPRRPPTEPPSPVGVSASAQDGEESAGTLAPERPLPSALVDDEDLGFLDFIERAERGILEATSSAHEIGSAMKDIGTRFEAVTEDINKGGDVQDRVFLTKSMKSVSSVMSAAATTVEREAEDMKVAFMEALDSLEAALEIQVKDFNNKTDSHAVKEMSDSLYQNVLLTMSQISDFRSVLSSTPRMNQDYNRAKLQLLRAIDALSATMQIILNRSAELSSNSIVGIATQPQPGF